jgi:hypothetical protein
MPIPLHNDQPTASNAGELQQSFARTNGNLRWAGANSFV